MPKPTRCTNVSNLFYFGMTLHVSDGLSVDHQEFKTVHINRHLSNRYCCVLASKQTATGICQTDTAVCLLAGKQQQAFVKQILLSACWQANSNRHLSNRYCCVLASRQTATGICQTDTAVCLLANRQKYMFDKCLLLYVQS